MPYLLYHESCGDVTWATQQIVYEETGSGWHRDVCKHLRRWVKRGGSEQSRVMWWALLETDIGNRREGCVAPLNQNQNKNTLSAFGVRPCLWRLHRCLLAPPQAAEGDVSDRWVTDVKARPSAAVGESVGGGGPYNALPASRRTAYGVQQHSQLIFCGRWLRGEQRSSCFGATARSRGSTRRTQPSDLLADTSSQPLLLSPGTLTIRHHPVFIFNPV